MEGFCPTIQVAATTPYSGAAIRRTCPPWSRPTVRSLTSAATEGTLGASAVSVTGPRAGDERACVGLNGRGRPGESRGRRRHRDRPRGRRLDERESQALVSIAHI